MSSMLSEETKKMITLKIKYDNPWTFKNRLSYCRNQVKNGTMTPETFRFIKGVIEKRKKGEETDQISNEPEDKP